MRSFENQVQKIKHQVYEKICEYALEGTLQEQLLKIPTELNPGPNPTLRCCVYHERAVTVERVQMSIGGDVNNKNLIEVLYSACDQCTVNRYIVTEGCRGCIAHRCQQSCPVDAITFINSKAFIDYERCIECGKCHKACPYNAISDVLRPCIKVCPTKSIRMDEHKKAFINEASCIRCGACVYHCPFGAIQDKSQLVQVISALDLKAHNIYAMVAPAIATQFDYASTGQIVQGIKNLGFKDVIEVAIGADLVAIHEAEEFVEAMREGHGFMTSSCCPGFVRYVHQEFPAMVDHISTTASPMTVTARFIKSIDSMAKVVFIGPCIAKKGEEDFFDLEPSVDYVLTFEELTGLLSAAKIDVQSLPEAALDNASPFGRRFATSGGVAKAVEFVLGDKAKDYSIVVGNGIADCKKLLSQAKLGRLKNTFIEGMACEGGCIKGPVTMHYGPTDMKKLESYCSLATEGTPIEATRIFNSEEIRVKR